MYGGSEADGRPLLEKAKKYRDFARWVGDRETVQRILALTAELKQRARALAKLNEDLTNEIRDDI